MWYVYVATSGPSGRNAFSWRWTWTPLPTRQEPRTWASSSTCQRKGQRSHVSADAEVMLHHRKQVSMTDVEHVAVTVHTGSGSPDGVITTRAAAEEENRHVKFYLTVSAQQLDRCVSAGHHLSWTWYRWCFTACFNAPQVKKYIKTESNFSYFYFKAT